MLCEAVLDGVKDQAINGGGGMKKIGTILAYLVGHTFQDPYINFILHSIYCTIFELQGRLIQTYQQGNHCAPSPPQILLINKVIHKHLRKQRIRLILPKVSTHHIPYPTSAN
jgi:hypothetical protein